MPSDTGATPEPRQAGAGTQAGGQAGQPLRPAAGPAPAAAPEPARPPAPPQQPAASGIEVRPTAELARMRPRHWVVTISFLVFAALPMLLIGVYLWVFSVDQYSSRAGFIVRSEESSNAASIFGGLTSVIGGGAIGADPDVIYEFVQSQDLVARVEARLAITAHYSAHWRRDPVFALRPGGTIEDLVKYWRRIVRLSYDQSTGLINIEVRAFSADMAKAIAEAILAESLSVVNELNNTAREDSLKYAREDLEDALARLKQAREAMVHFRTRTQIVDPLSDLEGRMGVMSGLQSQLAQALIDFDLISEEAPAGDPRRTQIGRRIEAIRSRIAEERAHLAQGDNLQGLETYPELLAEFERLTVDREFAEQSYTVAMAALDVAASAVARKTRYLATYLKPTLPEAAEYPRRSVLFFVSAFFLVMAWAIFVLIGYSLLDRR